MTASSHRGRSRSRPCWPGTVQSAGSDGGRHPGRDDPRLEATGAASLSRHRLFCARPALRRVGLARAVGAARADHHPDHSRSEEVLSPVREAPLHDRRSAERAHRVQAGRRVREGALHPVPRRHVRSIERWRRAIPRCGRAVRKGGAARLQPGVQSDVQLLARVQMSHPAGGEQAARRHRGGREDLRPLARFAERVGAPAVVLSS